MKSPSGELPALRDARQHVSALYQAHALGLVKLAILMVGDQPTAEDIVQDAFLGLYRRWSALRDTDKALGYLRSSVVNKCRTFHRVRFRRQAVTLDPPPDAASAEAEAMLGEAHREVLAALRQLPPRQREFPGKSTRTVLRVVSGGKLYALPLPATPRDGTGDGNGIAF